MALDPATLGLDTLVQYGAIGALLLYFLLLDHIERKRKNAREDQENKARAERDTASARREELCIQSNAEIRSHQIEVIAPLMETSNQIHRATLDFLRKRPIRTPLPDITVDGFAEDDSEDDETKIINRKK